MLSSIRFEAKIFAASFVAASCLFHLGRASKLEFISPNSVILLVCAP